MVEKIKNALAWLSTLTPRGRRQLVEMSRQKGRVEGAKRVMVLVANMNRNRRREWMRNVVKLYKHNKPVTNE